MVTFKEFCKLQKEGHSHIAHEGGSMPLFNTNEGVYYTDECGDEWFDPTKDSKYKYLLRKPINKLTQDEMLYLYAIHFTKMGRRYYIPNNMEFDDYVQRFKNDGEGTYDCLNDARVFFSKLKFPLKVYRAIRDSENLNNISGKQLSLSWTVDMNLYKADNSQFKHCTKIVQAEITADMVQNEWSIVNYVIYSSEHRYNRSGKYYPENEITLKPRYKNAKLMNLKFIDKNDL